MVDKQQTFNMDLFNLKNKVIIVTGASGLLGREHVKIILKFEGTPILIDINPESLNSFVLELEENYSTKIVHKILDITNEDDVSKYSKELFDKFGKIDGLVNNAANNPKVEANNNINFSRLENFPSDVWDKDLAVGLKGAFLCTKYFGYLISKNINGGTIINISSDLGLIAPDQRLYLKEGLKEELQPVKPVTYSIVKTGIIGLTRYISTYWADKNVRCNAICPGGVENSQDEVFMKEVCKRIPLGRMANKNDYQGLLVFLLSDSSSYINGAIIAADGGRSAW